MTATQKKIALTDLARALGQLPLDAVYEVLRCFLIGANKHGDDNIKAPLDRDAELDCIYRHYMAYEKGEIYDKDDGQHHLTAIIVRAMKLIQDDKDKER